jgi:hypothetical protein
MTTSAGIVTAPYEELAAALRGSLILPGDPGYDGARAVYNAMIDKRPAAIVRCRDTADVVTCVRFAREHGVEIAVRGGGHSAAGLGVWDDALVIDLSPLRSTTVSPDNHTVRADAGCTWGDIDHATVAFGMATPSGFLGSTGVAGLTLGGGIGYLSRRFGLTVDNLLAADVVLADGSFVTASASSHGDLFWALRGGGGNFGVVTSFTFRCHDIGDHGTVIAGPVLYDVADTADVMRWYRELLPSLPEELSGFVALLTIPPDPPFPEELWGRKACGIVWCYTGAHDQADEVLKPVKTYGSPLLVGLQAMPFNVLQTAFDALYPAGLQWYWRADFFNEISDAAIEVHRKYGEVTMTGSPRSRTATTQTTRSTSTRTSSPQAEARSCLDREIRVAGKDPGPVPRRLEHVLRQPAAHRPRRDRRRDAPGRGLAGQFRAAPLRQRRPARTPAFTCATTGAVNVRGRPGALTVGQPGQPAFSEPFAPAAHPIHIQPLGNRRIR